MAWSLRSHNGIGCHNPRCDWQVLVWSGEWMGDFHDRHEAILYRDGHPDGPKTDRAWMKTSAAIQRGDK